ncbi:MAG: FUSC family protein [Akkermansiaceae bacterium]|nr:FUSC family protein [Akkermansiaceae bacterium]MCP5545173.1 FUSC family protein [Akkermansiaceae bacterium]MCP5547210.1 FUSC family protein [Akkermansiaceae bacterium]
MSGGPSWHVPLLAAMSVAVPLWWGVCSGNPADGMLSATGSMAILYLPSSEFARRERLRRMATCALGFVVSFALGALGTFHPAAAVLALGLVTFRAAWFCRRFAIAPPASFFFVVTAAIAGNMIFDIHALPTKVAIVAAGAACSFLIALIYCLASGGRKTDALKVAGGDGNRAAVMVESAVIAASVMVSLLAAQLLELENPYWVPISCIAILQGGTFRAVWHRNVHRIVGSAVGMGISWFLFPPSMSPGALAALVIVLVMVVEFLVPRHYGLAVVFITPLTVCFAEIASGGAPFRELLWARLQDITLGSLIGAAGGWVLHHPQWCRRAEGLLKRLPGI